MTYYQDQQARGDTGQIAKDVERRRITAQEAISMTKEAAASGIITTLKAAQIEERLQASAT